MKTIILNHKMNLYYNELPEYIERTNKIDLDLIIAPSNIYLSDFLRLSKHKISSQDICYINEGNYTSKVSWKQIKSLGIKYSIVGHSERHEELSTTNAKLLACISNDIIPILCFGNKSYNEDIANVLDSLLYDVPTDSKIILAYEILFKMESFDLEYIKNQISVIKNHLINNYHLDVTVVYGGGITQDNIQEVYNLDELDGILIGGSSADIDKIESILLAVNEK